MDRYTAKDVMVDLGGQIGGFASAEICRDVPDRLECLAGLNDHDGQRLADVHR